MFLKSLIGVLAVGFVTIVSANHNLKIDFEWKIIDYEFSPESVRNETLTNGSFIPENVIPYGIEVSYDRIFITTPRLRPGVWSSLNYIYQNDASLSPKLTPYPNIQMHTGSPPEIISPYSVRKDGCDRLWVPDTGIYNSSRNETIYPPAFHIFNLTTNTRILKYTFPSDQVTTRSVFTSVALEVINCNEVYAYFADITSPAIVVYSLLSGTSWKITHPYFEANPLAINFSIAGLNFNTSKGIYGVSLSELRPDNFSTLYFSPFTSFDTFEVSTKVLRDPVLAASSTDEFKLLGNRGNRSQGASITFHRKTGILFYGMFNKNAVGCWNSKLPLNATTQGIVHEDNTETITTSDVTTDGDLLYVMSNKMTLFIYSTLNFSEYNFRIFKSTISEAINGTVCNVTDVATTSTRAASAGHKDVLSPVLGLMVIYVMTYFVKSTL